MTAPTDSVDIEAASPVAATALAGDDRVGVDDTSANTGAGAWVAVELQTLLDGLLRVAAASDCVLTVDGTAGKLIVRQRGGTPGTDEVQISHDGTTGTIESKNGGINLVLPYSTALSLNSGTSIVVGGVYVTDTGIADNNFLVKVSKTDGVRVRRGYTSLGWTEAEVYNAPDVGIDSPAAGVVRITDGATGGGTLELTEMTAPAAGAANTARLYAEDDGSGKTRLVAKWADGSTSIVATQP